MINSQLFPVPSIVKTDGKLCWKTIYWIACGCKGTYRANVPLISKMRDIFVFDFGRTSHNVAFREIFRGGQDIVTPKNCPSWPQLQFSGNSSYWFIYSKCIQPTVNEKQRLVPQEMSQPCWPIRSKEKTTKYAPPTLLSNLVSHLLEEICLFQWKMEGAPWKC